MRLEEEAEEREREQERREREREREKEKYGRTVVSPVGKATYEKGRGGEKTKVGFPRRNRIYFDSGSPSPRTPPRGGLAVPFACGAGTLAGGPRSLQLHILGHDTTRQRRAFALSVGGGKRGVGSHGMLCHARADAAGWAARLESAYHYVSASPWPPSLVVRKTRPTPREANEGGGGPPCVSLSLTDLIS
jgi:hypothetical protein